MYILSYFIFSFCSFLLWFLNFNFGSFKFFKLLNSAFGTCERAVYKCLIIIIIIIIIIMLGVKTIEFF